MSGANSWKVAVIAAVLYSGFSTTQVGPDRTHPQRPSTIEITLDDARRDPSLRDRYLDKFEKKYDISIIYDPTYQNHIDHQFDIHVRYGGSSDQDTRMRHNDLRHKALTQEVSYAAVPTLLSVFGRGAKEPVFVFPTFFDAGRKITRIEQSGDSSFMVWEFNHQKQPSDLEYALVNDADAESVIAHEAGHVKRNKEGIHLPHGVLNYTSTTEFNPFEKKIFRDCEELYGELVQLRIKGLSPRFRKEKEMRVADYLKRIKNADPVDPLLRDLRNLYIK